MNIKIIRPVKRPYTVIDVDKNSITYKTTFNDEVGYVVYSGVNGVVAYTSLPDDVVIASTDFPGLELCYQGIDLTRCSRGQLVTPNTVLGYADFGVVTIVTPNLYSPADGRPYDLASYIYDREETKLFCMDELVKVHPLARDYNGEEMFGPLYKHTWRIDELVDDRAVLEVTRICSPFHVKDLYRDDADVKGVFHDVDEQ